MSHAAIAAVLARDDLSTGERLVASGSRLHRSASTSSTSWQALAGAADAIVPNVHGVDVIPGAGELAGVEMSLVGELGRERFLHDALEPVIGDYEEVVIDTPPNLGLLTVNALVLRRPRARSRQRRRRGRRARILELRATLSKQAKLLGGQPPPLIPMITQWSPARVSSRTVEDRLVQAGLAPVARIRLRSALVAEAAAAGVPVARVSPDSTIAIAYAELVELLSASAVTR